MSKADSKILVEMPSEHPYVMIVTINRPPANPLTLDMFAQLRDLFQQVQERTDVRAIVLTGSGERIFCAGADVKEINKRTVEVSFSRSVVSRGCFEAIRRCAVPVIGAVNGTAIGAGLVLAACCDFVIATQGSRFSIPEVNVGTLGGSRHTGSMIPEQMMRYMALTGESLSVEELHRVGSILKVLPHEEVMPEALRIADTLAKKPPKILRFMREAINLSSEMPVDEGYRLEQLFTNIAVALPESQEASAAFMEKREPKFD